jgi:hypothetical protein
MWDSRALHCNCPGEGVGVVDGAAAGQAAEPELLRATVSPEPRAQSPQPSLLSPVSSQPSPPS